MSMQYNVCETCGAKDGRAGYLVKISDGPAACQNCKDSRKQRQVVIHSHLRRTDEEIAKTMQLVTDLLAMQEQIKQMRDVEDQDFCVIASKLSISRVDAISLYEEMRNA